MSQFRSVALAVLIRRKNFEMNRKRKSLFQPLLIISGAPQFHVQSRRSKLFLCSFTAKNSWVKTFGGSRVSTEWWRKTISLSPCLTSFRQELDQSFGSVWTETGVSWRHCTRLCRLPFSCPSSQNPNQSDQSVETSKVW